MRRICLLKSRKVYFTPYPRFTRSGKTRICLLKSRNVYFPPYPRFTCLLMSPKVYFTPYPRFTRSGKTRICLLKSRKAYFTPYPRFTYLLACLLTYLKNYLTTLAIHNIFVKIQWVDFQMGRVILTNYLNSHLNLRYSGHTAFKLVKRGCIFRLRRKTIPQHCTTILKTSFKIVCFRFWKC